MGKKNYDYPLHKVSCRDCGAPIKTRSTKKLIRCRDCAREQVVITSRQYNAEHPRKYVKKGYPTDVPYVDFDGEKVLTLWVNIHSGKTRPRPDVPNPLSISTFVNQQDTTGSWL